MGISTKNIREVEAAIKPWTGKLCKTHKWVYSDKPIYYICSVCKVYKPKEEMEPLINTKYLNNQENKTNGNH